MTSWARAKGCMKRASNPSNIALQRRTLQCALSISSAMRIASLFCNENCQSLLQQCVAGCNIGILFVNLAAVMNESTKHIFIMSSRQQSARCCLIATLPAADHWTRLVWPLAIASFDSHHQCWPLGWWDCISFRVHSLSKPGADRRRWQVWLLPSKEFEAKLRRSTTKRHRCLVCTPMCQIIMKLTLID